MTQKQFNRYYDINGKSDTSNMIPRNEANSGKRSRRPVLLSSENMEQMSIESSRARLLMQLLNKPEESTEETSQFRNKSTMELLYNKPITKNSSVAKFPVSTKNYKTYPSLVQQCLRWSPSIETFYEDSQTDSSCEGRSKCKCDTCKMSNYLSCKQGDNIRYNFKDNIVKFSDVSTMTRNVIDSGCGTYTPALTRDSNVSIAPTGRIIKNVLRVQTSQTDTDFPAPILKTDNKNNACHIFDNGKAYIAKVNFGNTPACNDYDKLLKDYTKPQQKIDFEDPRRVVFNESNGLKNNTVRDFSLHSRRIRSQVKLAYCHRVNKRYGKATVIPYNHQNNSKYHYNCKDPSHIYNAKIHEDPYELVVSPILKPGLYDPSIRLPKKVLTSERNIEAFMDNRPTKMSSIFKR